MKREELLCTGVQLLWEGGYSCRKDKIDKELSLFDAELEG